MLLASQILARGLMIAGAATSSLPYLSRLRDPAAASYGGAPAGPSLRRW